MTGVMQHALLDGVVTSQILKRSNNIKIFGTMCLGQELQIFRELQYLEVQGGCRHVTVCCKMEL
jgi:hypothetical protein